MRVSPVFAVDGHPKNPFIDIQVDSSLRRYDRRVREVGYAVLFDTTPHDFLQAYCGFYTIVQESTHCGINQISKHLTLPASESLRRLYRGMSAHPDEPPVESRLRIFRFKLSWISPGDAVKRLVNDLPDILIHIPPGEAQQLDQYRYIRQVAAYA